MTSDDYPAWADFQLGDESFRYYNWRPDDV